MESVLYGMNVVVFLLCLYALQFSRNRTHTGDRLLTLLSTALFLSATAHMSVNVRRLVEGYVDPPTKEAMTAYLLNITVKSSLAKQYTVVLVNLFSDILITWRVYMVWEKNWKICVIPALLCAGVFTAGIAAGVYEGLVVPGESIFLKKISSWATAQFSMSLAMNVTATLLIASRIIYVTRQLRQLNPELMRTYWRVIVIIVESAFAAAVMQILELAFYEAKFPVVYFIADSTVQIVAMAPLLIIVLVGLTRDRKDGSWGTSFAMSEEMTDVRFNSSGLEVEVELANHRRSRKGSAIAYTQTTSGSSRSIGSNSLRFAPVKDMLSFDTSPVLSKESQEGGQAF